MPGQELLIDRPNCFDLDLDRVEIQKRNTEFMRCGNSNRPRVGQLFIDEIGDQRFFCFLGGFSSLQDDFFRDNTVLHQAPW